MVDDAGRSLIESGLPGARRTRGLDGPLLLVLRLLVGLAAIGLGVRVVRAHATYVTAASDWGLPAPASLLWAAAALVILAGLLIVLGLAARLGALVVLLVALVAVASAGRVDGALALYGSAALAVGALVVLWRGGGSGQLLDRLDR